MPATALGENPIRLYDKKPSLSPAAGVLDNELVKSISEKLADKIPTLEKLAEYRSKKGD
jgi:hypothetical protein